MVTISKTVGSIVSGTGTGTGGSVSGVMGTHSMGVGADFSALELLTPDSLPDLVELVLDPSLLDLVLEMLDPPLSPLEDEMLEPLSPLEDEIMVPSGQTSSTSTHCGVCLDGSLFFVCV